MCASVPFVVRDRKCFFTRGSNIRRTEVEELNSYGSNSPTSSDMEQQSGSRNSHSQHSSHDQRSDQQGNRNNFNYNARFLHDAAGALLLALSRSPQEFSLSMQPRELLPLQVQVL